MFRRSKLWVLMRGIVTLVVRCPLRHKHTGGITGMGDTRVAKKQWDVWCRTATSRSISNSTFMHQCLESSANTGSTSCSSTMIRTAVYGAVLLPSRYAPRKPRYFNRVHTGYEWNKYNQTHYDTENPPPKVVQGYKFNIFYPDLIDRSVAPTYR